MAEEQQLPNAYPYSVKIESTSKGYRVHVHTYATTADEARDSAIKLLTETLKAMEDKRLPLAPSEGKA